MSLFYPQRSRRFGKRLAGFSLLELIIYIAFVSILSAVYINYVFDVAGSSQKSRVRQEVQQNGRFAMERILQEIRAADGVNVGSSTFGSHPGVLSLATPVPATNPTVFDVSGGVLRVTQGAGSPVLLTSDGFVVSNLVFENLSVNNRTTHVRVSLTIEHPNTTGSEIFNAQSTLYGSASVRELVD